MELSAPAGPGVEKAAEQAVESACHLADVAGPAGWSTATAENVLDALDTLTEALDGAGAEIAQAPAVVAVATRDARRRLGIAVDSQAPARGTAMPTAVPRSMGRRPTRRRGLGPGFQGVRMDG
ncbi:hypothetical protein ACIRD9_42055 [Streptomyces violaceus]|uniref:hypothetical protein n=1 Tax=Streptomyces violaceus TaxID=1936 RepID=UPI00380BD7A0